MNDSIYDEKPWLHHYDSGINEKMEIPEVNCADLVKQVFIDFSARPAIHFLGKTITFGQLGELSYRFANFLTACDHGKGNVVAINLPNLPQYLIAQAGALLAGWASTGLSPLLTPKEMAYQLNDSGAKVLVTLDAIAEKRFCEIQEQVPHLKHVVATRILDFLPTYKRWAGEWLRKVPTGKVSPIPGKQVGFFKEILGRYPTKPPQVSIAFDDDVLIQYTGGTTGVPKGTQLTHGNLVANLHQAREWLGFSRGSDVYCSAFPFFHLAGLAFGFSGLVLGNTQILIPNPRDTKHICKEIGKYRPSILCNVPSLYQMLLGDPLFKTLDFSSIRLCLSGAAPLSVETLKQLETLVGTGKMVEVYGMTETSPLVTMNPVHGQKKPGSIGIPIPNTRIKLVDLENGTQEVPLGKEGHLIVRGPQVMKGYLNKPEETKTTLRDFQGKKWLFTGDVAKMDSDGYFTLVDRAKDMLIVSGYKVFSREVEETLYAHPAIEACAIVGKPNPDRPGSELVLAMIQLKEGYKNKDPKQVKDDIAQYCKKNMAPYKVPKTIEFLDQLPLTQVGKVDKKMLRVH